MSRPSPRPLLPLDDDPEHLTTAQAADYLGVTVHRIRYLAYSGRLTPVGRRKVTGSDKPMNTYRRADLDAATRPQQEAAS